MTSPIACPMRRSDTGRDLPCIEQKCAWYVDGIKWSRCAVALIAVAIDRVDHKGVEVFEQIVEAGHA